MVKNSKESIVNEGIYNDIFNTFYLWLSSIRHMVKNSMSPLLMKENLMIHLTHFV